MAALEAKALHVATGETTNEDADGPDDEGYDFNPDPVAQECTLESESASEHERSPSAPSPLALKATTWRIHPDLPAEQLYGSWKVLIPTLVAPFLQYTARTLGKPLGAISSMISLCNEPACEQKRTKILCLLFDHFTSVDVVLVHFGFFLNSPSQPRTAVSIDLLAFYRARAMLSTLSPPDFIPIILAGDFTWLIKHLGHAVQWYNILQVQVEKRIEGALQNCRDCMRAVPTPPSTPAIRNSFPASTLTTRISSPVSLSPGTCKPILVQHCPACFGGTRFGRPLDEGGDIHVATDGNFHHWHRRSAGNGPSFYNPSYFISKAQVDLIGNHIEKQRKKPPKTYKKVVPDEAINCCESSYEAADGKKQKATMDSFDDTGLMALICRHDVPLFFVNIDSPGEQQKYNAPACLKKELDTVISLQADLDTTDWALQTARSAIQKETATSETLSMLDSLERTHERLMIKVNMLYASLNVQDKFPELDGVRFDFIRILLLAQDLKINFNAYCKKLEELYDPAWCIPLPTPLPTKLTDLRTEQSLTEDIWVMQASEEVPLWMEDQDVQDGIRGMLKRDHCLEEQCQLGIEADNLCRWYGDELAAVELALRTPGKAPEPSPEDEGAHPDPQADVEFVEDEETVIFADYLAEDSESVWPNEEEGIPSVTAELVWEVPPVCVIVP
ncbi:hypothetical protein PAXRUDRAFT_17336 [Paxillus rubicundulus Ve08.2h10]|uniref:CxC1-like cysteine cluster associated with KDZ transposases domain-containing protein n=1 Tax=Paxillus rubicundulus Ve08.2h10 TaxID=930991 RepID=A0A0D0D2A7_9AGAM|nr:hypothetical protein PAXRUDRAFT_17336 [Paxillus rubicundulus Ve08.2h10]